MALPKSLTIPIRDLMFEKGGILSRPWLNFFQYLKELIDPLGVEKSFNLLNNQAVPVKIPGLILDEKSTFAFIKYGIQRVTDANEMIESNILSAVYRPSIGVWEIAEIGTSVPDDAGVTFSISGDRQVAYQSTNLASPQKIFKLSIRIETLSGGNLVA